MNANQNNRYYYAFFSVALCATIVPLWLVEVPPLVDLPNHLARIFVLINYDQTPFFQQNFQVAYEPIPNMAMDLIVIPLTNLFDIFTADRIFLTLTIVLFAWFLATSLIVEKSLERADAILILSGSGVHLERSQKAALVYKQGMAPKILLTDDGDRAGWPPVEQRNPKYVEVTRSNLIASGIAPENIEILPGRVSGTIDEAIVLRGKIEQAGFKSVLIVTSPYHTRRSLWVFDKVLKNDDVQIGIVSPAPGEQSPPVFVWWLTSRGWHFVAGEYVKAVYYWFKY
jgi:uncharacterized SAM-binding protein YcdF (DUF218 family)